MRVPDWRVDHRGRTNGNSSTARHGYHRISGSHVSGHRCLLDAWSDGPCNRHLPRIPAISRYRLAASSNGGTSKKRIPTGLVTTREPRDRGSYGLTPDERSHVDRDSG